MQLSIRINSRSFVVFDSVNTTVARALFALSLRRFAWAVLQKGQTFFVFSSKELRKLLERAKSSDLLVAALDLERQRPSSVVSRRNATVTMEELPPDDSPACRAVLARLDPTGLARVLAVGTFRKARESKAGIFVDPQRRWFPLDFEGRYAGRGASRKSAKAKRAPAKKAAKGTGRFRTIASKPFSFGFADVGGGPPPEKKIEIAADYEVVDLFYATDREQKAASPAENGLVVLLNELSDPVQLCYGICSVTVPQKHKLGEIETPTIWTLKIQDRSKHFTISACSPRTKSEFFSQLRERIGKSDGQSCFVFIHGYNVSFEDAAMRTAQLTKDLKFPGVPILYSWASAHKLNGYSQDEETVSLTIKRLAPFLKQLTETSGATEIHLIAHSMGNRALIGALERLNPPDPTKAKPFKQVVLTAPDVPRKDVESQIDAASLRAERVTLYASRKDKALGLSKARHKYERLGKVYGFPYVLAGMDSIDASDVRTDFLAHAVFAKARTVLGDLQTLIAHGDPPDKRFDLVRLKSPAGTCWKFSL